MVELSTTHTYLISLFGDWYYMINLHLFRIISRSINKTSLITGDVHHDISCIVHNDWWYLIPLWSSNDSAEANEDQTYYIMQFSFQKLSLIGYIHDGFIILIADKGFVQMKYGNYSVRLFPSFRATEGTWFVFFRPYSVWWHNKYCN